MQWQELAFFVGDVRFDALRSLVTRSYVFVDRYRVVFYPLHRLQRSFVEDELDVEVFEGGGFLVLHAVEGCERAGFFEADLASGNSGSTWV